MKSNQVFCCDLILYGSTHQIFLFYALIEYMYEHTRPMSLKSSEKWKWKIVVLELSIYAETTAKRIS